jgi:hypothetical protein
MVNAKRRCASFSTKVGQRLQVTASFALSVAGASLFDMLAFVSSKPCFRRLSAKAS